jgi:hypothetical protein
MNWRTCSRAPSLVWASHQRGDRADPLREIEIGHFDARRTDIARHAFPAAAPAVPWSSRNLGDAPPTSSGQ